MDELIYLHPAPRQLPSRSSRGSIRDPYRPGMWRVQLPGGTLSDIINLARARDAARLIAARGQSELIGACSTGSSTNLRRAGGTAHAFESRGGI